jgi:hypothetical protein
MTNNNKRESIINRISIPPAKKRNLVIKKFSACSFLKIASEMNIELINNLNTAKINIKEIKFLCSDCMILLKAFTGVSISSSIVFQRSRLNILALRKE